MMKTELAQCNLHGTKGLKGLWGKAADFSVTWYVLKDHFLELS